MADTAADVPVPVADLPSGEPIPSSLVSSSSSSSPSSSSRPTPPARSKQRAPPALRALAAAAPGALDTFLARLNRCLSTPTGIDTVMLFVCYTSRLAGAALDGVSRSVLRRSARDWVAFVAALPPRALVLFAPASARGGASGVGAGAGAGSGSVALAAATLVLAQRLKALSSLMSEARTILRLWGLLGMYFWGRGLVLKALKKPSATAAAAAGEADEDGASGGLQTAIAWTQLAVCVVFQALENGAYLSSKGVMGWGAAAQARAFKWSARLWAVYVGIELGRLAAEAVAETAREKHRGKEKSVVAAAAQTDESRSRTDKWRREVARNLAWAPLTIHWSTDRGLVSELMVGLLGSIPGIIQMRELWAETA